HGEQLRSLRARSMVRALLLVWDERFTLLTIVITAFGRAVSEVGAVMVVGGNIEGYTRVMTTAIALETSKGDLPLAVALGLILLLVVLLLNILAALVRRWRERRDAGLSGLFGGGGCAVKGLRTETAPGPGGAADSRAPAPPRPLFDLHEVDVAYGAVRALRGVSLKIHAGECVALVGANGSGKSTLLRLLHCLIQPTRGVAHCLARRRQAMLFQHPYMLRTSALNNVTLGLWLRGMRWRDARMRGQEALARAGMSELAQRNAKTLSGGQQQR